MNIKKHLIIAALAAVLSLFALQLITMVAHGGTCQHCGSTHDEIDDPTRYSNC